jgi:xylan 1,4-beta-xylosidase
MLRIPVILLAAASMVLAQQPTDVRIDFSKLQAPLEMDRFALGQGGLSPEPMWTDRIPEIRAIRPRVIRLFIQEYFNVLPAAGKYDWSKLDQSVDTILKTGATPLMCIAIKPKVFFPKVDEAVTDPNDYPAWEQLIYHMVLHYKQRGSDIRYWEITNEPDIGENGGCPYLFTPEGYVQSSEHKVGAIRRADSSAKVGGPALANPESPILPALLRAVEAKHLPLDFISWHIYSSDPLKIRATIERKKELLQKFPSLHPETFLDEWNMSLRDPSDDVRFQPCFIAETAWQMKEGGLNYSCYYHIRDFHVPQTNFARFMSARGSMEMARWWNRTPQYDGLFDYQNHLRPAYFTFLLLARLTGQRVDLTSSADTVHGLAAFDPDFGTFDVLIWNYSATPAKATVTINGLPGPLTAHRAYLDATAASDDENIRLHPLPPLPLKPGDAPISLELDPYGLTFWAIH